MSAQHDPVIILWKEYEILKGEALKHLDHYKNHVRHFQVAIGAILAVIGFLLTNPSVRPNAETWWFWCIGTFFLPLIVNYLALDIVFSVYQMLLVGQRLSQIENDINMSFNDKVLRWELEIVPTFQSRWRPIKRVINPGGLLSALLLAVFLATSVALPTYITWELSAGSSGFNLEIAQGIALALTVILAFVMATSTIYVTVRVVHLREACGDWFERVGANKQVDHRE